MSGVDFYTVTASAMGTKGRGVQLQLRGFGRMGDNDDAEPMDGVELLHPLGIESRPAITAHTEAACVWVGEQLVAIGLVDQGRAKLTDLEEGETRVHAAGQPDAKLRLRADGSVECEAVSGKAITLRANGATITITANGDIELAPAGGRNVVHAAGSTPVAKEGSGTTGHAHTATFALTAPAGGGAVTGTITINSNTDTIATGQGSPRVKVP